MHLIRAHVAACAVLLAAVTLFATRATAQNYGPAPIMSAPGWSTVENAGQTWDGTWTFTDANHRTMSATWVNRQTGERVSSQRMAVFQSGDQITVRRPGVGEYVGTLSRDGRSISGTMSWIAGNFTARVSAANGNRGDNRSEAPVGPPIMSAPVWSTVENAGQTWDGTWTFTDASHRSLSGSWTNRQTGERVYAQRMYLRLEGQQIIITRPGTGDYIGTLSRDGRSISGMMTWIAGNFTARM